MPRSAGDNGRSWAALLAVAAAAYGAWSLFSRPGGRGRAPAALPEREPRPRARPAARAAVVALSLVLAAAAVAGGWAWHAWDEGRRERALVLAETGGTPEKAPALIRTFGCAACHVIEGIPGAEGRQGPPLERVAARAWIGGVLPNSAENLVRFIVDPHRFVPGSAMPRTGISEAQARDVAAFLLLH